MFRLTKVTDYGIRILAHLARDAVGTTHNAREVAEEISLPVPMVSKVMKSLARAGSSSPRFARLVSFAGPGIPAISGYLMRMWTVVTSPAPEHWANPTLGLET